MMDKDIACVGMGYVGLAAALSLANKGCRVKCVGAIAPATTSADTRSTALFPQSVELLKSLNIWRQIEPGTRPLRGIRIVDETRTLFRAPEITFNATDCGLDALAVNVPNNMLHHALLTAALEHPDIDHVSEQNAAAIHIDDDTIVTECLDGTEVRASILIGADGRDSLVRKSSGIGTRAWSYDQVAITCAFRHDAPHDDISTEFHRPAGPMTTVPGISEDGQHHSHLVWIEKPQEAERLAAMTCDTFLAELETRLQGLLGPVGEVGPRGRFPIRGLSAKQFASGNTFLLGEAAHVMPPIGAQGMNLGFRDIVGLIRSLEDDVADSAAHYNKDRRDDVWMRTTAVDLLNRSLTTPYWPAQFLRGAGLHVLNTVPALKRAAIRAGFGN